MAKHSSSRRKSPVVARLAAYRPVLDRAVFGVALLGLLVTAHLYIQQERGFDRGCLGFSEPSAVAADCAVVTTSGASTLFGVSNAIWGFVFYLVVAALSLALPLVARGRQAAVKRLRGGLIAFGFLYSLYLVFYQVAQVGTFCVLCLTSAALVATLFALQAYDYFKPQASTTASAMSSRKSPREVLVMSGLAVLAFVLIGADFAYFRSLDATAGSADQLVLDAVPPGGTPGPATPAGLAQECPYDPEVAPVADYASLVSDIDPMRGNPDAPVTVIEYFDPNCPHCATLYPIMEQVAGQYGDRARFVYKPFVLWQHSVAQSAALYAAAQEGKFFDMLTLQFANQQPRGLSAEQLRAIAARIGMNPDVMMQRIQSGIYTTVLQMQQRQAQEIGLNSVPAVLINGRLIANASKTPECLGRLIEAAAQ